MNSLNSNRNSRPSLLSGGDLPSDLTIKLNTYMMCRKLTTLLASCTTPDHFTVESYLLNGCCAHDTALFNYFKDLHLKFNKMASITCTLVIKFLVSVYNSTTVFNISLCNDCSYQQHRYAHFYPVLYPMHCLNPRVS